MQYLILRASHLFLLTQAFVALVVGYTALRAILPTRTLEGVNHDGISNQRQTRLKDGSPQAQPITRATHEPSGPATHDSMDPTATQIATKYTIARNPPKYFMTSFRVSCLVLVT